MKAATLQYQLFDDAAQCKPNADAPLDVFRSIAQSRGGECLSTEYLNSKSKLRFRCERGHVFDAEARGIKHANRWCPECNNIERPGRLRNKNGLVEMIAIAASRGGRCLSDVYINSSTKMQFRCADGHEWDARPLTIKRGHWCPVCVGNRIIDPLLKLQQLAAKNGGECLSTDYVDRMTKLRFRCADGHEWDATPGSIVSARSWCPRCVNRSEALCRQFLECVFDAEFREAAPKWLNENRPRQYRLDGYNANLRIAFEYHGDQHFRDVSLFHRNGKTLQGQLNRDNHVREKCKAQGITLVEFETVPVGCSQEAFIELARRPVEAVLGKRIGDKAIGRFLSKPFGVNRLQLFRNIARDKGGDCLSTKYLGNAVPLHFRCTHGHEWHAKPMHIKNVGSWCPFCAGRRLQNPLAEIRSIAKSKGGECLSLEYINSTSKLRFRCAESHEWETTANSVKNSESWCPICAGTKVNDYFGEMRKAAELRGGVCLSEEQEVSRDTKIRFKCGAGHEFLTTAGSIRHANSWCPICSGHKIIDPIGRLQAIARGNGGECLSLDYINSKSKLRFRCVESHEWETTASSVTNAGSWCPICASTRRNLRALALKEIRQLMADYGLSVKDVSRSNGLTAPARLDLGFINYKFD